LHLPMPRQIAIVCRAHLPNQNCKNRNYAPELRRFLLYAHVGIEFNFTIVKASPAKPHCWRNFDIHEP